MLAQTVTKGTAPTLSVNVDPATNRITTGGYSYDSNGNLTAMPLLTMSCNVDNRLAQATSSLNGTDQYVYDPQGRRVWKSENGSWTVYFYGIDGNLLGRYWGPYSSNYNIYFGRKLIYSQIGPTGPVVEDRLASTVNHFPVRRRALHDPAKSHQIRHLLPRPNHRPGLRPQPLLRVTIFGWIATNYSLVRSPCARREVVGELARNDLKAGI